MASKVNTKFVVGLVAGAAVVFAVVALAYVKLVQNTPERLVAAGDAQLKVAKAKRDAGDAEAATKAVEKAIVFYSKAVNKQQTNVELLKKWDEGLREYAPANRDLYQKAFKDDFMLIRRQTAVLLKTDVQAHRDYLDVVYKQTNNATVSPESVVRVTDEMLQYFDLATDPAEKAKRDGILRYRGIALAHQAMQIDDTPAETFTKARTDLEAALRYDPKDAEAAEALYSLGIVEADRATKLVKTEEAAAARARSEALAQKFLADNPRNPMLTLAVARTKFVDRLRELRKVVVVADRKAAEAEFRAAMLPVLEDTVAAFEAADPAKLSPNLLPALAQMEATIDRAGNLKRTVALVKRLAEAKPGDAEISLYVADFASRSGDFTRSIAEAQKVESAPVKPIGLEGIQLFGMKRAAAGQAAGWALDLVETAGKDADRTKLLEHAKQLRDLYAGYVEPSDPALKLVNGRLAFAEGRVGEASRLFKEYNEAVRDSDVRGLLYASMSAISQASPNTGYAKERLQRILSMDSENRLAMIQLARVAILEQDLPSAEVALKSVLDLDPENKLARDMWNLLHNDASAPSDPVVVAIKDALAKVSSGKEKEAIEDLRGALVDHPGDLRIVQALTQQLVWSGDRAGALEVVEAGLRAKPDEVTLQQLKTVLTSKDPLETDITLIKQADAPRLLKLIRLHMAYKIHGKETEALAQLETAEKEFPDAPELVETRFIWALGHEQWDVANKALEKAVAGNLDNADGLTFKSRLQAARGQVSDAIGSAEAALAKVPANPEMYRLLGKLLGMQNRLGESIAAFKNAVDARPTDAAANQDYVGALLSAGRTQEALEQCRKNPRVTGSDRELTSMWMNLEAQIGDKKMAMTTRERIYHSDPLQRDNALALAELYIGDARYADAMKLVEEARAHEDGLDVANIEAMCLDAQKKPEEVASVFKRLIASTDATKSMNASLTLSRYLISRGDTEGGIAVMEAARARQDPKIAEIDRAMTQLFQQLGMLDRAVESARKVVAASGDADGAFRKEIVRMLLRGGKFDEADREYAGLVPLESNDPNVLLLKSDTKLARGDKEAARFILDDAVARFSQQPVVFNVRATYHMRVTGQFRDAATDLTKSLALNPMQPSVLMSRAQCYVALGQQDDALADLERLARLTPADPVARKTLLTNRLDLGQADKAVEDGVELLKLNNGSPAVASEFGAVFGTGYGKWDEASKFYKLAFDSGKSPDAAAELVVSYLKQTPPKLSDAGTIINQMGTAIPNHWPLLLARARWQKAQEDKVGSRASLTQGLTVMGTQSMDRLKFWLQIASEVIGDRADLIAYLEKLERDGTFPQYTRWFRGSILLGDPATMDQGLELLRPYTDPAVPAALRQTNFQLVSGVLFAAKRSEAGVALAKAGLEQFPDDPSLLNNVAYVLAKELGRADEALPIAEHATKVSGLSADAYDTLGFVQLANKKYPEAMQSLGASLQLARNSDNVRATTIATLHMGLTQAAMGDKKGAKDSLGQAQNLVNQISSLAKEFESELAELTRAVE